MRIDALNILEHNQMNTDKNQKSMVYTEVTRAGFAEMDTRICHAETADGNNHTFFAGKNEEKETQVQKGIAEALTSELTPKQGLEVLKQGFDIEEDDAETIVTVMDKIRLELAKAGKDVTVFGDELNRAQLEKMLGDANLAPDFEKASLQAESLEQMDEGAVKYMMKNQLPATIENVYMAQHVGNNVAEAPEELLQNEELREQVGQVIAQTGQPVTEEKIQSAIWMMANDIPVTEENIAAYERLMELELPPAQEALDIAMAEAVVNGGNPQEAILAEVVYTTQTVIDEKRAQAAVDVINEAQDSRVIELVADGQEVTVESLKEKNDSQEALSGGKENGEEAEPDGAGTAQTPEEIKALRVLEETRLLMTKEAVVRLLRQGIEIETRPLEELVESLKELEKEAYAALLESVGMEADEEQVANFAAVEHTVREVAAMPAATLGSLTREELTLENIHESGAEMEARFQKANEAYETMMTSPRADLGDNIQTAFRNVDDILEDLGLEATKENQRAVRILAYNEKAITSENIAETKAVDRAVQLAVSRMTPKVVMRMIREGYNPLDVQIDELNQKLSELAGEQEENTAQKYSEYLWKLERQDGITQEERDTYIGIYRLLHQVEKSDGAVIGAVMEAGEDVTLKNLLTQSRNNRAKGMELRANDETGELVQKETKGLSITEQIQKAYETDTLKQAGDILSPDRIRETAKENPQFLDMTPEQFLGALSEQEDTQQAEYVREQIERVNEAFTAPEEVVAMLEHMDYSKSAANITAVQSMLYNRNKLFRDLFEHDSDEIDFAALKEELLREFGEAVKTPEDMAKAQEKLADIAENVMKTMMESESTNAADLRAIRLAANQISMGSALAKREEYAIPVLVADEMANVTLKIVRGTKDKGKVAVLFETLTLGKVAAEYKVTGDSISGYVAADRAETLGLLEKGLDMENTDYLLTPDLSLEKFQASLPDSGEEQDNEVATKRLYGVAREFLRQVSALEVK